MTREEFVKAMVASPVDTLTGTEENLGSPWTIAPGAANIGKRTATGATTQTTKAIAGAIWGGTYVKSSTFILAMKLVTLPAEAGQVINLIMNLEGGTNCEIYFVRQEAGTLYLGVEYEGVTVKEEGGKTWAAGDTWGLVCWEGKFTTFRITSGSVYSELYVELGSNAKVGKEPHWIFNPETKASTAIRLANFSAGGIEEAKSTAGLSMMV